MSANKKPGDRLPIILWHHPNDTIPPVAQLRSHGGQTVVCGKQVEVNLDSLRAANQRPPKGRRQWTLWMFVYLTSSPPKALLLHRLEGLWYDLWEVC
jgi:hypothetical protein